MAQSRRRTRRIDPEVYEVIVDMASRPTPFSGPRILEELERRFGAGKLPSIRTIQDVVRELAPIRSSESWTIGAAEPADVPIVLPVLAELIRNSDGRVIGFDLETGRWIARLRRADPEIPANEAFHLAIYYQMAESAKRPTYNLDIYVALQLWRSASERMEAIRRGWLHPHWRSSPDRGFARLTVEGER